MTFLRFASRIKIIQPWQFMSFQGVLCIDDMDLDVLNEMIHYIYCGKCTKDITEMASDLLIAADKYRLEELKARKFYFKKTMIGRDWMVRWKESLSLQFKNPAEFHILFCKIIPHACVVLNANNFWLLDGWNQNFENYARNKNNVCFKSYCEKFLIDNISNENACQLLIMGDMYNAPRLRQRAVQVCFPYIFTFTITKINQGICFANSWYIN